MRSNLYRLGRYAARRPWVVIGAWLVVAALVVAASGAFGKKLEESFGAPGVDSQSATDLLSAAGADQAGLTAQVVVTPLDEQATLDSPELRAALTRVQVDRGCVAARARGRRSRHLARRPGRAHPASVSGARQAGAERPRDSSRP